MNKYLIDLLKENNTIIIPGLGALTVTDAATGELMFMSFLQHDDGKLSGYIAEKDGVDEQDAKNTIAKYVREIQSELDKGETVDLYGLGSFVKASSGDIEFTNWAASTSAPAAESSEETDVQTEETVTENDPVEIDQVESAPEVAEEVPQIIEEVTPEMPVASEEMELDTVADASADVPEEVNPEIIAETTEVPFEIVEPTPEIEAETPAVEEPSAPEIVEESPEPAPEVEESNPIEEALEALSPMVEAHVPDQPEEPVIETLIPEEPEIEAVNLETPAAEIPIVEEIPAAPIAEEITVAPVAEEIPTAPVVEATAAEEPKPKKPRPSAPVLEKTVAPNAAAPTKAKGSKTANGNSEAKKRGAGFWILMVLLVLLAGGGTYFALNYDELKQHIPFLADEKETVDTPEAAPENADSGEEESYEEDPLPAEEEVMEEETPEEPVVVEKPAPVANTNGAYHIVSGAFSSEANANRLMESFKSQGLPARVIQNNGLNVVCMQSYATSAEAKASLPAMKEKAPGAWILHKP